MQASEQQPTAGPYRSWARFENLYELLARLAVCDDIRSVLGEVLDASLGVVKAEAGFIRLFEPGKLEPLSDVMPFVAHRGLSDAYVEYFTALARPVDDRFRQAIFDGRRVCIADMTRDPSWMEHGEVVVAEGYRTIHATPLMSRSGSNCVGAICCYFADVHVVSPNEEASLDIYAEIAGNAIDQQIQFSQMMVRNNLLASSHGRLVDVLARTREKLDELSTSVDSGGKESELNSLARSIALELQECAAEAVEPGGLNESHLEVESPFGLTFQEIEILLSLWRGESDARIAAQLGVSRFTLSKHLVAAMRKLHAQTREQATDFFSRDVMASSEGSRPTVGELLRSFRIRAGLTQAELATRSGLSHRTISDIERGVRSKTYNSTVGLLSSALELDARDVATLEASIDRSRSPRLE